MENILIEKEDENMKPIISGFDRSSFLEDNNRKIVKSNNFRVFLWRN